MWIQHMKKEEQERVDTGWGRTDAGNEHRSRERKYKANCFPNFSTAVGFVDVCLCVVTFKCIKMFDWKCKI